uniref:ATP synthase subunit O, mitochondrial n=1 Tax=Chromera velia CCMP2878 TaxID=1169474 RepID=A0A0G4G5Q3_9ALVE|mmetsp:Transcript_53005/g.103684  ORF Transcript_53005/g.103684 Transcript_53005/m.103684 type:complete len:232 (-) Transcript_53005:800-1495(-)|eukprot:Cvel_20402.t1-p1 / transcript=Cvel_20402.t1 / gene=Cvel_20402 / organism=Chromera_velia_CCMP2878 / gene_product=ATP synthase subunit 5, mitochondrial, putative / transcript_product=ATP synthase subunit 5, mitochondrial, putative / location=Cvel_scaffold1827:22032-22724(-) / protein_length=231 / sequence_SO=supercontig / SO=protein_coding / is_pseudo=false
MRSCTSAVSSVAPRLLGGRSALSHPAAVAAVSRVTSNRFESRRSFAAGDGSLHSRYAEALLEAAKEAKSLDKVWANIEALKEGVNQSKEFKLFIETPGISGDIKGQVIADMAKQYSLDTITHNFLKVLLENRRLSEFQKIAAAFEAMYRLEKGEIACKVTSAEPLSSGDAGRVLKALQARAGAGKTVSVEYEVKPALMGGLVVKMGEAILDFSVAARLDRIAGSLAAPLAS